MAHKGYPIDETPGHLNVVYIEGVNADGSNNSDEWNRFNDRRIVFKYLAGMPIGVMVPEIIYNAECTTEPGYKPTLTLAALKRGGIFRIAFGHYAECWQMGFHKGAIWHPALIQVKGSQIFGHRDKNGDGKRTGDQISLGSGINQHGTRPGFTGQLVNFFSEGCLVARHWADQQKFIELMKTDARYILYPEFRFSATVIPGDTMNAYCKSVGL